MRESTKVRHEKVMDLLNIEIARLPGDVKDVCFNDIYRRVARQLEGIYDWKTIKYIANQNKEIKDDIQ